MTTSGYKVSGEEWSRFFRVGNLINRHDGKVLGVALAIVVMLVLIEFFLYKKRWACFRKMRWEKVVVIGAFNLAMLILAVGVGVWLSYQVWQVQVPDQVRYERMNGEEYDLIRIRWENDGGAAEGVVLWGYDEKMVNKVAQEEKEVLLEVEKGRDVYFCIQSYDRCYGPGGSEGFYVSRSGEGYELEPVLLEEER